MLRIVMAIFWLSGGFETFTLQPQANGPRPSLDDYTLWRAGVQGFDVFVSESTLSNPSEKKLLSAGFILSSLESESKWAMARCGHGCVGVLIRGANEELPIAPVPAGIEPYRAWRLCCGVTSDGRYAMGCTGWWPNQSTFQLIDLQTRKVISEKFLPWTDPRCFSGFVQDENILGHCLSPAEPNPGKGSEKGFFGSGRPKTISRVYSVLKSGQWTATEIPRTFHIRASPSGSKVLIRRTNPSVLEIRSATLSEVLWTVELKHPVGVTESRLEVRGGVWTSDERIVAVPQRYGAKQKKIIALDCYDAADGTFLGRAKADEAFWKDCVIVITPADSGEDAAKSLGVMILPANSKQTEHETPTSDPSESEQP